MLKYSILLTALVAHLAYAQTSSSSGSTTAIETPQTSTAQLPAATPYSENPFSVSVFMLGGYNDNQFRNAEPSFGVFDSYVALNYSANKNVRVSLRPAFGYTTKGFSVDRSGKQVEQADKATNRDFSIAASIRNILKDTLSDSLALKFKPRLFLPTSDGSKAEGMISKLRLEWELKYYTSKTSDLKLVLKPNYYFQRGTSFTNEKGRINTTRMADTENYIEYNYELNKTFAIKPSVGQEDTWYNVSPENNLNDRKRFSRAFYGGGFEINPTRDIGLTVGVRTYQDVYQPANSDETSYTLMVDAQVF